MYLVDSQASVIFLHRFAVMLPGQYPYLTAHHVNMSQSVFIVYEMSDILKDPA